ncbi:gluconate kinase (SKI family) [Prauserella shujinwangii]|uniref:Gluconokinase n=1 Tax=Prauserella shujinwangii TaxID=1453103 RepID=A0A2T0M3G0_9PSEU|nr:gluconokinase [Prauserella shujinwangii]PRX51284.1 gluconate kinase (SKI family) [Prauserella shujinwangii]
MSPTCLVVMGVSGVGKTTAARLLSQRLGWPMAEADEFHPAANIAKMAAGTPLTDADRTPWLTAIRDWIGARGTAGEHTVVTCSALKRAYRDVLRQAPGTRVRFVHLRGTPETVAPRLAERSGHFMPPSLLESQFRDLEPLGADEDGVTVDVSDAPEEIVARALTRLGLAGTSSAV